MSSNFGKRFLFIFLSIAIAASVIVAWNIFTTRGATIVWDGGGGSNDWSEGANWVGDTAPGASDLAVFDGTSTKDATIDGAFGGDIGGMQIDAAYTGTITQSAVLNVGTQHWVQDGGTFVGGASTLTMDDDFTLNGGSFTAPSGTLILETSSTNFFTIDGGTFIPNGVTLDVDGPVGYNADTTITIGALDIDLGSSSSCFSNNDSDRIIVTGTVTLTDGNFCNDIIVEALDVVTIASTFDGADGTLEVTAGAGAITVPSGAHLPTYTVSVARATTVTGVGTAQSDGDISLSNGATFDAGTTSTFRVRGGLTLATGAIFDATTGVTFLGSPSGGSTPADVFDWSDPTTAFNHNGGTIEWTGGPDKDLDVNGSVTFNNMIMDTSNSSRELIISSGDTIIVLGDLELDDGSIDGPGEVEVQGTVTHIAGFGGGTTILDITGATTINPDYSSGFVRLPGIRLTNVASIFNGSATSDDTTLFEADVEIPAGTFNSGAGEISISAENLSISGGTFNHDGGKWLFQGSTHTLSGALTFNDVELNSSTLILPTAATTTIVGALKIEGGNFSSRELQSDTPGVQATIDYNGAGSLIYGVDILDIDWDDITELQCHFNCADDGNNTNISFNKQIIATEINGPTSESADTATFQLSMTHRPSGTTTLAIASTNTAEGTPDTTTATFTTGDWDTPQIITVTGVDDALDDGDVDYTITIGTAASPDPEYAGFTVVDVPVVNKDNDSLSDNVQYDFPANYTQEDPNNTEIEDSFGRLLPAAFPETFVSLTQNSGDGSLIYDAVNDSLWFAGASENIHEYEIVGDTLNTYAHGAGAADGRYLGHDTVNNRFWMTLDDTDEYVVFNDDGTVFTSGFINAPVGSAETPNRLIFSDLGDGSAANDAVWIGHESITGVASVIKYNAGTAAPFNGTVAASTFPVLASDTEDDNAIIEMTYATGDHAIWVFVEDENDDLLLVKLDAATGAPFNGSLANSTYPAPNVNLNFVDIEYDSTNDYIWVLYEEDLIAFNALNGEIALQLSSQFADSFLVDNGDNLLYMIDIDGDIHRYDIANERFLTDYPNQAEAGIDVVLDGLNNIWVLSHEQTIFEEEGSTTYGADQLTETKIGVNENEYYTIITDAPAYADGSIATDLGAVVVTETLNNQSIFYSLSFDDGETFEVWGSWREIASDQASVHGGVNGTWYFRDNASIWTPAATDSAEAAISEAVEAGTNNQMSGSVLNGLSETDLESVGGWSAGDDVGVGATFFSDNYLENPGVDNIFFDFTAGVPPPGGGGGGGDTPPDVSNLSLTAPSCSPTTETAVLLNGSNINSFLISEDAEFFDADWMSFASNVDSELGNGTDGEAILTMSLPYTLSSVDEVKTVYVRFRNNAGSQSGTFSLAILLDVEGQCEDVPEPPPEPEPEVFTGCEGLPLPVLSEEEKSRFRLGISPMAGEYVNEDFIFPGDLVRGENFSTVYCITSIGERRPYMDETTYFTHTRTFGPVKWVQDEVLPLFTLGAPMLPQEGVVLLKFESSPHVYYFDVNDQNPNEGVLRWISDEELAAFIAGEDWASYVIDLNPTLTTRFNFAAPFLTEQDVIDAELNVGNFRERRFLNEVSKDEINEGLMSQLLGDVDEVIGDISDFIENDLGTAGKLLKWLF